MENDRLAIDQWKKANPELVETLFHVPDNDLRDGEHRADSFSQRIIVRTGIRSLIDRYVNREIGICLHFHALDETTQFEAREKVIILQKTTRDDPHGDELAAGGQPEFRADSRRPGAKHMQSAMPIFSRPIIENPKGSVDVPDPKFRREIGSLVRLYRFDETPTPLGKWSNLPGGILEFPLGIANRKFQILMIGGRILPAFLNGRGIDARVESGTKLIEHLAELECEDIGQALIPLDNRESACPVALHIEDRAIGIIVNKGIPGAGEGIAVSFCPVDTIPTPLKAQKFTHEVNSTT
jgi:hypothetical protein